MQLQFRNLERENVSDIWSIDRSEFIERVYLLEQGKLVLVDEPMKISGWPPDEIEHNTSMLLDCFDHEGFFVGAYDKSDLVGVCVMESRFIGLSRDQLQLKFLHVSRKGRGKGLGRKLFMLAAERAKSLSARKLYISSAPSENTVRFYQSLGCRLAIDLNPALIALEPYDIHLEWTLE